MGTQCVRSSVKQEITGHYSKMGLLEQQLRHCEQNLLFTMTIEHLRLTNMTDKVKQIRFSLENQFQIIYSLNEFNIQENLIKSEKIHKTQFQFPAKKIHSKLVLVQIIGINSQIIETVTLKLIHLCTGPVHHDHLLKQLRARLMFDIHLYQNINLVAKCKSFKITPLQPNVLNLKNLTYKFALTTQIDEKTLQSNQSNLTNNNFYENQSLSLNVPNNILKSSNFRFQISNSQSSFIGSDQINKVVHSIFIPYRKIQTCSTFTTLRRKQIDFIRKSIPFNEPLEIQGKVVANISFIFKVQTSILYAQQMECLIMSENGVSSVSPSVQCQKNHQYNQEIQQVYKRVKKIKNITLNQRSQIIKSLDELQCKFQKTGQISFTSEQELYERQIMFTKLLNELSVFFVQGDDILNEKLWQTINQIVHKPELSARYLTLHKKVEMKRQVYFLFYKFMVSVLLKIIAYTESGITFHELQCIQKFIAFCYFRFPWIQNKIIKSLSRKLDPIITEEKLIQYGANAGCRSPSKSYVFDWEDNIYNKVQNDKDFKEIISKLEEVSDKFEGWDRLLFSRQDEDLFYGLYLEIWTEAQITLASYRGKILWEYFPNYGKLLSCFLGQMNNSKISDFSNLFRQCSNKLVLNQKLLNTFVIQLFPKTYLFQISCVLKCLNLLESYFQVLTKQNKKLPHDFHFNYFYTGIKSIFQQNHSYLIVKVLQILYKYYDIFTQEFKKTLTNFLVSNIFFCLFLHWCTNVRQMFHHLIYHKLIHKKISNPEETQDQINNSKSQCTKLKEKMFSEQCFFNQKINFYLRTIENFNDQKKKELQKEFQKDKHAYHEKMKLKMKEKKKRKNDEKEFENLSESKLSEDAKSSSFVGRKLSLFAEKNDFQFSRLRKMSLADQQNYPKVNQDYRKYCQISLKEYQQVKRKSQSLTEVNKLAKLVQGDIDS